MAEDYDYFRNKRADRVYLSRSLEQPYFRNDGNGNIEKLTRPFRIVSKTIDCQESHQFIKDGKQVSLRITDGQRQEIIAKFYEDSRGIFTLTIQKYTMSSGMPHQTYFSFVGPEIATLYNFIRNVAVLPLVGNGGRKLDDKFVEELVLTKAQAFQLLQDQPGLAEELQKHQITAQDVAELGHRRDQLKEFKSLLSSDSHFEARRASLGQNKRPEDVWQAFFERNTWIFGYGLNYFLNTPLDGERLEQVTKGHDLTGSGKRVDALLKTRGLISALSFGEIKTHKAALMKKIGRAYRAECWQVSDEISGGIAQVQKTVQISLQTIGSRIDIKQKDGSPSGEHLYLYQPKAFLVIGSLSEFQGEHGINEEQYSSFELFRRNIVNPEIVTFDELYERAQYIVECSQQTRL